MRRPGWTHQGPHSEERSDCQNDNIPFLWDSGSIFDLNALIPAGSSLTLYYAVNINDRGEIAGLGADVSGNEHAFLLVPCDEAHPGVEGCDYSAVDMSAAAKVAPAALMRSASPRAHGRKTPFRPRKPRLPFESTNRSDR